MAGKSKSKKASKKMKKAPKIKGAKHKKVWILQPGKWKQVKIRIEEVKEGK